MPKVMRDPRKMIMCPEEAAEGVARVKDALGAQVLPRGRKVGKRDAPIGLFLVDMRFVAEVVDPIWGFGEIPFVKLTFMVKRNLGVDTKKWREKV